MNSIAIIINALISHVVIEFVDHEGVENTLYYLLSTEQAARVANEDDDFLIPIGHTLLGNDEDHYTVFDIYTPSGDWITSSEI